MPATYDWTTATYRISCRGCGTGTIIATYGEQFDRDARSIDGALVRDTFPFVAARGEFYTQCRTCDAARRAATRARRGGTVRATASAFRTGLGHARKFGVELETICPRNISHADVAAALTAAGLTARTASYSARNAGDWLVKPDGSLSGTGNGIEITSPALVGQAGLDELRVACRVLADIGATTNRTCGTHVHHDAADLTIDEIKRVVTGWSAQQDIVDGLVSPSRRNGNAYYARPFTSSEVSRVQNCTRLSQISGCADRYRTMNLQAYGKFGTLEIRQHQGTISFAKIAAWVALGQAIIDTAIESDRLATPATSIRGLMTGLGTAINETARTFLIGRAAEFGAVAV